MKTLRLSILLLGLLLSSVFFSCKKENTPPDLPPAESMAFDFSSFDKNKKSALDDTTGYGNWSVSALTVGFWSIAVWVNSAVPVAAFKESFNHEAKFIGNASWEWTYKTTVLFSQYTCVLSAKVLSNTTKWEMRLSQIGGFQDFIWFEGESANDLSNGTWRLYEKPETENPYLDLQWERSGANLSRLRYTYVLPAQPGTGNYLEYQKINEGVLDAGFLIRTVDHIHDQDIQWSKATEEGRIKYQQLYKNANWHCWDNMHKNTLCE